jgi:hypothetical protein
MKGTTRTTVRLYNSDKKRLEELKTIFSDKGNYQDVMRYLVSLENSHFERGTGRVEKKLKQWLYLGYSEEITVHKLRVADYGDDGEHKSKYVALKTVRDVCEKYKSEIDKHNEELKTSK